MYETCKLDPDGISGIYIITKNIFNSIFLLVLIKTPVGGLLKGQLYELVITTKNTNFNYGYNNEFKGFKPILSSNT